tara:strand:- start:19 stop:531 length:513 start_codon:yes stop_codon:yes gene_type:complete
MDIDDEIKGLFLLVLAITGNFIGETLGCKTQKLLTNNMILKQVFIVFMIFFALSFTSSDTVKPTIHIKKAIIVWTFYILFTKMNLNFTILAFLLLLAIYILGEYKTYYKSTNNKEMMNKMEHYKQLLTKGVIILVVLGFVLYFMKQYQDHKKDFSMLKYLFGVKNCQSLM